MSHLDDGTLVRLLDREATAAERAELGTHIAACDVCRGRQAALAAWASSLSQVLARSDAPPRAFERDHGPAGWHAQWGVWSAAAAVVLLVAGTVALAAPVRTWVIERWTATVDHLVRGPGAPPRIPTRSADQTPAPASPAPVGAVSFTPEADTLVVRVAARQAEGSLILETSAAPTASAVVRGQGEHEAVVVLPTELRIANTAASRATYHVTLPTRLKQVVVVIDGDRALSLAPVAPGESRAIDLKLKGRR